MLTTRHPLDRLYSAFKDKFMRKSEYVFRDASGKAIKDPPTFERFLQVASQEYYAYDPHWTPVYAICRPCKYNYDFVLKTENFTEESMGLLKKLNLADRVVYERKHESQALGFGPQEIPKPEERYKKLLENVTPDVIR